MSDYENPYLREVTEAVENKKLGTDPGRLAQYEIKASLATATELNIIRLQLEKLIRVLTPQDQGRPDPPSEPTPSR